MRRFYIISFIILALLTSIQMMAQQTKVIVGYGETYESIAAKYGVSINELRAANPGKDNCYAGMEIVVPLQKSSPIGDKNVLSIVLLRADSMLINAKKLSNSGNYKKAIKIYNRVLDMKVRTPYAYAGLGECYFGLNKFKDAKKNLRIAINSGMLANVEREWCEEALEDVEKEIEAKRERRNAAWANVGLTFATAIAATATAYAASEQAKMQNRQYQNSMPSSYASGSDHLDRANQIIAQSNANINQMMAQGTANLNMMTQNSFNQAQQTKLRMERAFKEELEWRSEYYKNNGIQATEYEVDQWYAANYPDLLESRILARGKMNADSNGDDKKENKESRPKIDYSEKFENRYSSGKQCVMCLGTKHCQTCLGKGWYNNPLSLSDTVLCPNCDRDHNGDCSHCHGTGKNP